VAESARHGVPALAAGVVFAFALVQAVSANHAEDFFIYRFGSEVAARGESPYDIAKVKAAVAAQFPDPDPKPTSFVNNCGYFLPPAATLLFLPFAVLPWAAAKVAWAAANGLAAYCIARLPWLGNPAPRTTPLLLLASVVLVLNPVSLAVQVVGQSTPLFVGFVAAGLFAFGRGKPYLAAVLWAVPFVKPHLALPLVPLAWFLGGWRPAAVLVALVGGLNLAGASLIGGSPLFLQEYFDFLPTTRDAVAYNRVALNPTIPSWNRLLLAAGGPVIELGLLGTLAGYLMWFGLIVGRCALAGTVPARSWAVAAASIGAVLCSQVLVYELLFLTVAVPWVRDLFASGLRVRGWLAVAVLATQSIPYKVLAGFGVEAHHAVGVAAFAVLLLTAPLRPAAGLNPASGDSPR
jgi:hypothetical protein